MGVQVQSSVSWRGKYLHVFFGILLLGRLMYFSHLFIYPITDLLVWAVYIYLLDYDPIIFILLLKLLQLLPLGTLSGWLLLNFMLHPRPFVFWPFPFWYCKVFSVHLTFFSTLTLESAISPKGPGSFYWRIVFRNQDLVTGSACYCWSVISSRWSQRTKLGHVGIYINLCIHAYL